MPSTHRVTLRPVFLGLRDLDLFTGTYRDCVAEINRLCRYARDHGTTVRRSRGGHAQTHRAADGRHMATWFIRPA